MKTCTKCGECKEQREFHKKQSWCKQCQRKLSIDLCRERRTGCSPELYNGLYEVQQGCCAICGIHASKLKKNLAADHCHISKKIRGLLCVNCNQGLGQFKDNLDLLFNAIVYLRSRS